MSATIIHPRFSARLPHPVCVTIFRTEAWLVLTPKGHGWMFGSLSQARSAARWLSNNLELPIEEYTHAVGA